MSNTRPILLASLLGLGLSVAFGAAVAAFEAGSETAGLLGRAHVALALQAFLVPAFTFLHLHALERIFGKSTPARTAIGILGATLTGAVLLAGAILLTDGLSLRFAAALATGCLVGAAGMSTGLILRLAPKESVVRKDVTITKGDDACVKVLRFAHFFLPVGVLGTLLFGPWWAWSAAWTVDAYRAFLHVLLVGHGLLSIYALGHLWIPRFSGVPAIAAGAIKGELHTTLLGLVLLAFGFGFDSKGLRIGGGAFLFIGMFTFMGVLGANIMKRKSPTAQVLPEFSYVPWTFSGVFWLIAGILLGLFLNALPAVFAEHLPALRFVHAHAALWAGFAQLLMGWGYRTFPAWSDQAPPRFERTRVSFWLLNLGMVLMLFGSLGDGLTGLAFRLGAVAGLASVAAYFISLAGLLPKRRTA